MSPQRRRHEGRLLEKPSELFNRRHTKQQSFDAIRTEIDGDHRIRALVLRFDDLSQTVMVMGDSVAYLEIRDAQSVVAVQRTCRSRFRQILWLGAARGDLTEPYDDRDEPYEPYEDEPECDPPEKRRLPEP